MVRIREGAQWTLYFRTYSSTAEEEDNLKYHEVRILYLYFPRFRLTQMKILRAGVLLFNPVSMVFPQEFAYFSD
jgi:hypothetical protein